MPRVERIPVITVVSGVNGSIIDSQSYNKYRIEGTAILGSNWEVALKNSSGGAGTPVANMTVEFEYKATVTLVGNHITILGSQMPDEYASKEITVRCYYNGSAWVVKFEPDFQETNIIKTSQIIDANVTLAKVEGITRGNIINGNASGRPTSIGNTTAKVAVLMHDVNDSYFINLSGDVELASTGVSTIGNAKVDKDKIASSAIGNGLTGGSGTAISVKPNTTDGTSLAVSANGIRLTNDITAPGASKYYGTNVAGVKNWYDMPSVLLNQTVVIEHANILTGNTVPIVALAAPGALLGYVVDSVYINAAVGTPYATNTTVQIITDTAAIAQFECANSLLSSTSRTIFAVKQAVASAAQSQIIDNKALLIKVKTGNPTAGDVANRIIVNISYRILEILY